MNLERYLDITPEIARATVIGSVVSHDSNLLVMIWGSQVEECGQKGRSSESDDISEKSPTSPLA